MNQVLYNSSRGLILQLTDPNTTAQISRFAIHFDPLMLIFAPFYWVYPHAEVLLIGQTLFVASGAIPVYLLAQLLLKKLKHFSVEFGGVFFAFLYLAYFPLQNTNLGDFHAVVLATPLLLWSLYCIEVKKFTPALILLGLCLLAKENVALTIIMVGLYIAFFKKNRRVGLSISAFSFLFFILIMGVIIPANRHDLHFAESYYTLDILTNMQHLFSFQTVTYIFQLLQPMGFLPLFSPFYLLIAAPEWMINLLSKSVNMTMLQYHYTAILTPFIVISSIYGFRWLAGTLSALNTKLTYLLVGVVLLFNFYTLSQAKTIKWYVISDKERLKIVDQLEKRFDGSIPLATSGHLAPHFSSRIKFYNVLFDFAYGSMGMTDADIKRAVIRYEAANYVIVEKNEMENTHKLVKFYYDHLKSNNIFELVFDKHGIEIYHKKGTPTVSLKGI
jgi:uncharacterized membrane protein